MDSKLEQALGAALTQLEGARQVLDGIAESIQAGDLNGALANLHMGFSSRLDHLREEAEGLGDRLLALGGVYPPPPPV